MDMVTDMDMDMVTDTLTARAAEAALPKAMTTKKTAAAIKKAAVAASRNLRILKKENPLAFCRGFFYGPRFLRFFATKEST